MRRTVTVVSVLLLTLIAVGTAQAQLRFAACATGAQEAPPPGVDTDARAALHVRFDPGLTQLKVALRLAELDNLTQAHFHCGRPGSNGPVAFGLISPGTCELKNDTIECTLTNANANLTADCLGVVGQLVNNIASLRAAMEAGLIYVNVHTSAFGGGEIRGQVMDITREGCLGHGLAHNDPGAVDEWLEEDFDPPQGVHQRRGMR